MVISSYPMDFSGNVRAKCKKQEYIIYNTMVKRDNCVIVNGKIVFTTHNLGITWVKYQLQISISYIVLQSNGFNVGSDRFNGVMLKVENEISYTILQQEGSCYGL